MEPFHFIFGCALIIIGAFHFAYTNFFQPRYTFRVEEGKIIDERINDPEENEKGWNVLKIGMFFIFLFSVYALLSVF